MLERALLCVVALFKWLALKKTQLEQRKPKHTKHAGYQCGKKQDIQ